MKDEVANIKKDSKNDLSVVLKIQELVANNINTYPIPGEFTGFVARNPIETWNSNGGTPFEKCLLLTTLYREAGINAEPLMIVPTSVLNDTIGVLQQVTDYLVQVNPRELEQMILSPVSINDQNLAFSMDDKTMFVLNEKKPQVINSKEKYKNKVEFDGSFILNDSMIVKGNAELQLFEKANPYFKIKKDSSSVKQLVGGFTVKEIESFKVINSSQVRSNVKYEFKTKQPVKNQANYYFLSLPVCKNGSDSWHINYLSAERIAPFEVPFQVNEKYNFTYTLPDNIKLLNPIELTEFKTDFGEIALSITQDGNEVKVKRTLSITERFIPVAEYKTFKQMMDLWNEAKYRELVLKK